MRACVYIKLAPCDLRHFGFTIIDRISLFLVSRIMGGMNLGKFTGPVVYHLCLVKT